MTNTTILKMDPAVLAGAIQGYRKTAEDKITELLERVTLLEGAIEASPKSEIGAVATLLQERKAELRRWRHKLRGFEDALEILGLEI